jgi:hypothetical protein
MIGNKPKKVVIEDARIFIPGNAITKGDQDSVSAILRQYRKSLYKVQTFQDGNPSGKAKGTLADEIIGTATVAQVKSDAKQDALSGWGFQIGSSTSSHPTNHPSPTPRPSGSPSHPTTLAYAAHPQRPRNADEETSREMVAKIAPILQKYSQ